MPAEVPVIAGTSVTPIPAVRPIQDESSMPRTCPSSARPCLAELARITLVAMPRA